jgi:hypothetical protein
MFSRPTSLSDGRSMELLRDVIVAGFSWIKQLGFSIIVVIRDIAQVRSLIPQ